MENQHVLVESYFSYDHLKLISKWVYANAYMDKDFAFELSPGHWVKFDFLIWPDYPFYLFEVINGVAGDVEKKKASFYEVRVKRDGAVFVVKAERTSLAPEQYVSHVQQLLQRTYARILEQHPLLRPDADGMVLQTYLLQQHKWLREHPRLAETASTGNNFWQFIVNMWCLHYFVGIFNEVPGERFSLALAWPSRSPVHKKHEYALFICKLWLNEGKVDFLWQPSLEENPDYLEDVPIEQVVAFPTALQIAGLMDIWLKAFYVYQERQQVKLESRWLRRSKKPCEFVEVGGVNFELRRYDELANVLESLTDFAGDALYALAMLFEKPYTSRRRPSFFLYCAEAVVIDELVLSPYLTVEGKKITVIGYVFASRMQVRSKLIGYDLDYSAPLICLGDAQWHYALLCGHSHYVGGNLQVDALWGQYNHGRLVVKGQVNARLIFEDDFDFDFQQMHVDVLLGDVQLHQQTQILEVSSTHDPSQVCLPELIKVEKLGLTTVDTAEAFNDAFLAVAPLFSEQALRHYRTQTIPRLLAWLADRAADVDVWRVQQQQWRAEDCVVGNLVMHFFRYVAPLDAVVVGCERIRTGALAIGCTLHQQQYFVLRISPDTLEITQLPFDPQRGIFDYQEASALHAAWVACVHLATLLPAEIAHNAV